MNRLFAPITIKNLHLRNRIMMAPMCMYSSDCKGHANEWHFTHYETRAIGGVGLVMVEATAVESRGRITDEDLGIWDDSQIEGLSEIVRRVKRHGARIGIQLAHAGRKCEVKSEDVIAPSSIKFDSHSLTYKKPRKMERDDIEEVFEAFRQAAERALAAGFDIIEIHGAHGYLINQFMSPVTNERNDEYGGSVEKRAAFLREIVKRARLSWPSEKPLCLRVSAEEYCESGNRPGDVAGIINLVKEEGIDIINVSSGGLVNASVPAYEGYQTSFAETVKTVTGLPVISGGLISKPSMADEIIRNNRADMVFFGRELLRNPYWPLQASKELNEELEYWPEQYLRAK